MPVPMPMPMTLSHLFVYPVKSLRGLSVNSWPVDEFGFKHDRRWMVIDRSGVALTLRELPRMTLIEPSLKDDQLELTAPGMSKLMVPSESDAELTVTVWGDSPQALDCGPAASAWLSDFLNADVRLVYMPDSSFRRIDRNYCVDERRVSFTDGYPFLLISQESLDELNRRLDAPIGMERFRPNLVVSGASAPHAEDDWKRIRIGVVGFDLVKLCARCAVPTVDPETGEGGKEPTRTLATYRRKNGKVYFGQNLIHDALGTLAIGDRVEILI